MIPSVYLQPVLETLNSKLNFQSAHLSTPLSILTQSETPLPPTAYTIVPLPWGPISVALPAPSCSNQTPWSCNSFFSLMLHLIHGLSPINRIFHIYPQALHIPHTTATVLVLATIVSPLGHWSHSQRVSLLPFFLPESIPPKNPGWSCYNVNPIR